MYVMYVCILDFFGGNSLYCAIILFESKEAKFKIQKGRHM